MQWIEEHLGVLVGFAVAGFYLVTQFLEAVKKQREAEAEAANSGDEDEDEDEDWGGAPAPPPLPRGNTLPSTQSEVPQRSRQMERTRRTRVVLAKAAGALETKTARASELARQAGLADRLKDAKRARSSTRERTVTLGGASEAKRRLAAKSLPTDSTVVLGRVPASAQLRQRSELRRAVVLREILDKPVGLK